MRQIEDSGEWQRVMELADELGWTVVQSTRPRHELPVRLHIAGDGYEQALGMATLREARWFLEGFRDGLGWVAKTAHCAEASRLLDS